MIAEPAETRWTVEEFVAWGDGTHRRYELVARSRRSRFREGRRWISSSLSAGRICFRRRLRSRLHSPRTNGFLDRFPGTVLEEFFRPTMRRRLYESVDALRADLDGWLHHCNHERTHFGYRNQGRRPWKPSSAPLASHPQDKEVKQTG